MIYEERFYSKHVKPSVSCNIEIKEQHDGDWYFGINVEISDGSSFGTSGTSKSRMDAEISALRAAISLLCERLADTHEILP